MVDLVLRGKILIGSYSDIHYSKIMISAKAIKSMMVGSLGVLYVRYIP